MIEVKIPYKSANEILDIVREMRAMGLVQGTDFDFAFSNATYGPGGFEFVSPKQTVFKFYKEHHATLFSLRWA